MCYKENRSEISLQKLIGLDCQDSILFDIYQIAYKWRIKGDEFILPFFAKYFVRTFKCSF